jgi:hypothetical protein
MSGLHARHFGAFRLLLLIVFSSSCRSPKQSVVLAPLPEGWVDWNTPDRVNTLARRCAADSKVSNTVKLTDERVQFESKRESLEPFTGFLEEPLPFAFRPAGSTGARRVLQLQNGWLVGFNHGEFGGSLWWVDSSGTRSTQLLDDNVTKIHRILGHIYVFTNVYGKSDRGGAIYEFDKEGKIRNHTDFTSAPREFVQETSNSFLVVGGEGVFRVNTSLQSKQLSQQDLSGFSPNSIAIGPDQTIYIGLNCFVLRLISEGASYREQWLVPSACKEFHIDLKKRDCVCDGP